MRRDDVRPTVLTGENRMKRNVLTLVALAALAASCAGVQVPAPRSDGRERWACFDIAAILPTRALVALARDGLQGEVRLDGKNYPASFRFAGIKRRWDFGFDLDRLSHLYAITIGPDGIGHYSDFSTADRVDSSQTFRCRPRR